MEDILSIFNNLKDMYIRYMDSPFALGHPTLAVERRALLEREGVIYRLPYIEALPPFVSSGKTLRAACESLGLPVEFADFAANGLFGDLFHLHKHQFEALRKVLVERRNVVVTSGTGSGKTESFLLPLIASVLNESKSWSELKVKGSPWWLKGNSWEPQRKHETRTAAIRGLILYPLNALVEDQLTRLRKALDSDGARKWLDEYRQGNRIYFGRYTSKTPVSGRRNDQKIHSIRRTLLEMKDSETRLRAMFSELEDKLKQLLDIPLNDNELITFLNQELGYETVSQGQLLTEREIDGLIRNLRDKLEEKLSFIVKPDGAEMVSRWDMQEAPPDILITNFSMLNIMLTRKIEQNMFEQTKQWLESDSTHTFFLIVDELHSYRGTAGTEVSYVLRALLHRLGLTPDSPQLRIIATSASLDDSGREFLGDFFGVHPSHFDVLPGERETEDKFVEAELFRSCSSSFSKFYISVSRSGNKLDAIRELCEILGSYNPSTGIYQALYDALNSSGAIHEFVKHCKRPRSILDLSKTMFGQSEDLSSVAGFLLALATSRRNGQVVVPFRGHLFFRNFQGLWACSNPHCDAVDPQYRYDGRPIGKFYTQPQVACTCGGRILDLYYCQNCGDVFLGGYKTKDSSFEDRWILSADFPDLEQLPDKLPPVKIYGDYAVYWPSLNLNVDSSEWNKGQIQFAWRKAAYNPYIGSIELDAFRAPTGHWFQIRGDNCDTIPAFPIKCPNCGDDWENRLPGEPIESIARTRSPIRGQRTGFDKISQVLIDALMREVADEERPKIVLFSDSRQDAAKLSVKIEQGHYLDLLRRVVVSAAIEAKQPLRAWIKYAQGQRLSETERLLADKFRISNRHVARDIEDYFIDNLPNDARNEVADIVNSAALPPSLKELWDDIAYRILSLGMNPGGPYKSLQKFKSGDSERPWTDLYTFRHSRVIPVWNMTEEEERHYNKIKLRLREEVVANTLFSQRKRDIESLALGMIITDPLLEVGNSLGKPASFWRQLFDSSIRILGAHRRYSGSRKSPVDKAPVTLRDYWIAVAQRHGLSPSDVFSEMESVFRRSSGVQQYIIQPDQIHIIPYEQRAPVYVCSKCHRVHLHPSCQVCTACFSELQKKTLDLSCDVNDYYRYLAKDDRTEIRIHAEELTGQTDTEDALRRQKLFQGIFDANDIPLVDEIDVLSVTTTMEAGVDIGALKIVAMSNMPPQRFNYQQRVGRCGRRGVPLSVSLTICRGRSHDDWYFDNLDRITGDPPPQPYIDLKSEKIFRRVLVKELLFRAFHDTKIDEKVAEGLSVHGDFGRREEWPYIEDTIRTYLSSELGRANTKKIISALAIKGKLTQSELEQLFDYVTKGGLIDDIRQITSDARYVHINALSECLATAGLLPMFGFPTRLRLLYHQRRTNKTPARMLEKGTIDRDLEIAITEYAPASEVVKEKAKHRVVGVAHYVPHGSKISAVANPVGRIRTIALCKHCQMLFDDEESLPEECPSCRASKIQGDVFRHIPISEPMGFRSDWIERDFTEEFEWVSRGSSPRLAQRAPSDVNQVFNTQFYCQEGDIYVINDNNGKNFTFIKAKDPFDGWIEKECHGVDGFNPELTGECVETALASIKNTEVLVLYPLSLPPGITFNPKILGVRAALYSFGFLLRRVASDLLDIDADELQVGIRSVVAKDGVIGQIFLGDRLINGAGYSRYLGQPHIVKQLLEDLTRSLRGAPNLRDHQCDSSCYECLRTYENMSFHGLLDWRLALDVARVLVDRHFILDTRGKWNELIYRSLNSLASSYQRCLPREFSGLPAIVFPNGSYVAIFGHPLWHMQDGNLNETMTEATAIAKSEYPQACIVWYNFFDLIRRPVWIVNDMLRQGRP